MRVHQLAKDLGTTSADVLQAAATLGFTTDHHADVLTPAEETALRAALAPKEGGAAVVPGDGEGSAAPGAAAPPKARKASRTKDATDAAPHPDLSTASEVAGETPPIYAGGTYVQVRREAVSFGGTIYRRGDKCEGTVWVRMPERVRLYFDLLD